MNKYGGSNYEIKYHYLVVKEDIAKLSQENKVKIKKAIEQKLAISPEIFGKPLRKSLSSFYSSNKT